jgi:hypothetical protein
MEKIYISLMVSLFIYKDKIGIIPPNDCNIIMVTPKGSGITVCTPFYSFFYSFLLFS